jgi:hypothetical protein
MNLLIRFHKDESGMIIEWLVGLIGLLFLVVAYALFMPVENILIDTFVENGSPLAPNMFIRQMEIWAFLIFGVLCLAYPFVSTYRKTYDSGIQQMGGWR